MLPLNRVVFPEPSNPVRMVQGVCHRHRRKERIPTNIAACLRRRRIFGDARCSDDECGGIDQPKESVSRESRKSGNQEQARNKIENLPGRSQFGIQENLFYRIKDLKLLAVKCYCGESNCFFCLRDEKKLMMSQHVLYRYP